MARDDIAAEACDRSRLSLGKRAAVPLMAEIRTKGRPRGSPNLATDLSAELGEQITVREGGQARQVSKQRALIKSLMAKALQGDVRATTALLALYARVISEPPEDESAAVEEDELLILRRFGPRLLKSFGKKEPRT